MHCVCITLLEEDTDYFRSQFLGFLHEKRISTKQETLHGSWFLSFAKAVWIILLCKKNGQWLIVFNHQIMSLVKLFRHDKVLFFEIENPYRKSKSWKSIAAENFVKAATYGFQWEQSIIVCTDPYRAKFNRRIYGFAKSTYLPLLRLKFDYDSIKTKPPTARIDGKKQVGYVGRVTTETGADMLLEIANRPSYSVVCCGRLYHNHLSKVFLESPLCKSVVFHGDLSDSLKILSSDVFRRHNQDRFRHWHKIINTDKVWLFEPFEKLQTQNL